MRHHIPNIHDPIADIDVSVEETDKIVVAHPRFGPGVDDRGKSVDVVQQIRSGQSTESRAQAVSGDEQVFAFGCILLDEIAQARAYGVVHQLKSFVHGAASGDWSVRRRNKIKIVKPVVEKLDPAKGDSQFSRRTSTHTQPKCRLGLALAAIVRTAASVAAP